MKQTLVLITFVLGLIFTSAAQSYSIIGSKDQVEVNYRINKKKELQIRFKNKSKSPANVDAEIGIYNNGILEETSLISDCLKNSFFANLFRPIHIIQNESLSSAEGKIEDYSIELIELKVDPVDECRETDS